MLATYSITVKELKCFLAALKRTEENCWVSFVTLNLFNFKGLITTINSQSDFKTIGSRPVFYVAMQQTSCTWLIDCRSIGCTLLIDFYTSFLLPVHEKNLKLNFGTLDSCHLSSDFHVFHVRISEIFHMHTEK